MPRATMPTMTGRAAAYAASYPYDIPPSSYILDPASGVSAEADLHSFSELCKGRSEVLALGSNSAPSQLLLKFRDRPEVIDPIPVVSGQLVDHDVVYSAHLSLYGAVPATLTESEGTTSHVFITYLTGRQVERMHETERLGVAYELVELPHQLVTSELGLSDQPLAYRSLAGTLLLDGRPCCLAAVAARNRRFPSATEEELLERIAAEFTLSLKELVDRILNDDAFRTEVEQWMRTGAKESPRSQGNRRPG